MTCASQFRPAPPPALTRRPGPGPERDPRVRRPRSTSAAPSRPTSAASGSSPAPGLESDRAAARGDRRSSTSSIAPACLRWLDRRDDAFIAVFEAKYHYNFWRPVTAIRNADLTDNPATTRDPHGCRSATRRCIRSTRVRIASRRPPPARCCRRVRQRDSGSLDDQPHRAGRDAQVDAAAGLQRRGRRRAHLRRLPLPLLECRRRTWAADRRARDPDQLRSPRTSGAPAR